MPRRTSSATTDDMLRTALTKEFGQTLFDATYTPRDYISTGLPALDLALGTPGLPCGRLTTIYGNFSSGKSAILYKAMGQCQQRGGLAVLLETEDAIDIDRLDAFGMDDRQAIILQPGHLTEVGTIFGKAIDLIEKQDPDRLCLIGWDSVGATPSEAEVDEEFDKYGVAVHARTVSRLLRKYMHRIAERRICVVFINQEKEKIGGMPYAENDVMIADRPLRFGSTFLLRTSRKAYISGASKGASPQGITMRVQVRKNKLGAPQREAETDLYFDGRAFDVGASWADAAVGSGWAKKDGSWITVPEGGEKLQRSALGKALLDRPEWQLAVRTAMVEAAKPVVIEAAPTESEDDAWSAETGTATA